MCVYLPVRYGGGWGPAGPPKRPKLNPTSGPALGAADRKVLGIGCMRSWGARNLALRQQAALGSSLAAKGSYMDQSEYCMYILHICT